jgi:protein-S-isoprenylcysteine O-methyltransferase Ste14
MAKSKSEITPERRAFATLFLGSPRSSLPADIRPVYDRIAKDHPELTPVIGHDDVGRRAIMSRWAAVLGSVLLVLFLGLGLVLVPWLITGYQPGAAPWPAPLLVLGAVLILGAGVVAVWESVRFVRWGTGLPWPLTVTSSQMANNALYGHVRNPMYLAATMAIIGQALLISRPVLLIWAAGFLALCTPIILFYEQPLATKRFSAKLEASGTRLLAGPAILKP